MALLSPQGSPLTGGVVTYNAVNSTDTIKYTNAPRVLLVKNGSGGSINVTVVVPGTTHGQANPDVVVAVAAGAEKAISGFTSDLAVDGIVTINYSATTTVTAALLSVS